MAQNRISLAAARGNFLTWCITGYMPLGELCRPLYFAQKLDEATDSEVGEFYPIYSLREARRLFGPGSIAVTMAIQHFCTCPELPLYIAPVDDPTIGSQKAQHTITVTGPATDNGVLSWGILDEIFAIGVIAGSTAAEVATGMAAVMKRWIDLPFDVEQGTGVTPGDPPTGAPTNVITLTAKNAGSAGNWFEPVMNPNFGDRFPAGLGLELETTRAGVGVVDVVPALPVMACQFDCVATGFEDEIANNLVMLAIRNNWRCTVQGDFKGGHLFHSRTGTCGLIYAYGMDRNNPEETVIPIPGPGADYPDAPGYKYPGYMLAAAAASRTCCTACYDPSRPVQYDNGILGCMYDQRKCTTIWDQECKKMFYDAGIMNWDVANTRGARMTMIWIEEPLTTYKWDPATGAPDGAWQRMESRYTVTKFVRDLGYWYRRHYASVSLVSDGVAIPAGKRAVNPRIMQASILAWFRGTQLGWTAELGPVPLEEMIRVERTNTPQFCDPNRLNVLIDLDLVNQLARIATTIDVSPEFACLPPSLLPGQVAGSQL